jgi:MFS family permease
LAINVLFVVSHLYPVAWLLIPMAIFLGIANAILWTAHGTFLEKHGDQTNYGTISGIFYAILMMNLIVGNLFAGVLFRLGGSETLFIIILSVVATIGLLMWFLLKDPSKSKSIIDVDVDNNKQTKELPLIIRLLEVLKLFGNRKALMMTCPLISLGLNNGYYYGTIPIRIQDKDKIGFVQTIFGVGEVCRASVVLIPKMLI